jgi:hypothetical protein
MAASELDVFEYCSNVWPRYCIDDKGSLGWFKLGDYFEYFRVRSIFNHSKFPRSKWYKSSINAKTQESYVSGIVQILGESSLRLSHCSICKVTDYNPKNGTLYSCDRGGVVFCDGCVKKCQSLKLDDITDKQVVKELKVELLNRINSYCGNVLTQHQQHYWQVLYIHKFFWYIVHGISTEFAKPLIPEFLQISIEKDPLNAGDCPAACDVPRYCMNCKIQKFRDTPCYTVDTYILNLAKLCLCKQC